MKYKSSTQVFFPNYRIFRKFLRCALKKDFTFEQQVSAIRDAEGFRSIMVRDKDTDIFFLKFGVKYT